MNRFKIHFLWLFVLLQCNLATGQVFPGDANNDGVVNNLDILYIGYAYGSIGPSRDLEGTDFTPSSITLFWDRNFSDALNFVYADADGDGFVGDEDFLAVATNYGLESDVIMPVPVEFPVGTPGVDPLLSFEISELIFPVSAGAEISVPILLGDETIPVQSFNGIAFTIVFDTAAISDVQLSFENSWTLSRENAFGFQYRQAGDNHLDATITRLGPDVLAGKGKVATLSVVIEENLIDFLRGRKDSINTIVKFEKVLMVDNAFQPQPVVTDSIQFKIFYPAVVSSTPPGIVPHANIFPNPVATDLFIECTSALHRFEIYDIMGTKRLEGFTDNGVHFAQINCRALSHGTYFLKLYTQNGFFAQKIVVDKP